MIENDIINAVKFFIMDFRDDGTIILAIYDETLEYIN